LPNRILLIAFNGKEHDNTLFKESQLMHCSC
jgi:hypothetical protein